MVSRLLDANRQQIGDPRGLQGTIYVVLDVQQNDETVTDVVLTLGGENVSPACRGDGVAADMAGLANSGQVEVECVLETAATVTDECVGMQLMPEYMNGEYDLGAFLITADGDQRDASASQTVELKNHGYVKITHNAGKFVPRGGVRYYGGPTAEDNMNSFSACPVSFTGTEVGALTLESRPSGLSFQTGKAAPDNDPSPTIMEGPYTWEIDPEFNAMAEGTFRAVNSGEILDADGTAVTDEFRANDVEAKSDEIYFDFKAPTLSDAAEIQVAKKTIVTGTSYSVGKNVFSLAGAMDGGVGIDGTMTMIAVGDCAMNETDPMKVDRTKVGFMAIEGYEDVSGIADLDEEDAARNAKTDKTDVDCYVAELAMLVDQLGNAWMGGKKPEDWLQTANFGVDKTPPTLSNVAHDDGDVFNKATLASTGIDFEFENPDLASGDPGTPLSWTVTRPGATPSDDPVSAGSVDDDVDPQDPDDARATVTLSKDGEYDITVTAKDGAMPANEASFEVNLVYDNTAPTFAGPEYMGTITGGRTATIDIEGSLKDATAGIYEYTLAVFANSAPEAFCGSGDAGDTALPATRLPKDFTKARKAKGGKSVAIPSFAVNPPDDVSTDESLCVELTAEDRAGNSLTIDAAFVSVDWADNVPRLLVTEPDPTTFAEGATVTGFAMALSVAGTGDVTIEFESSNKDVVPAPADITLATTNTGTTTVPVPDVTAGNDNNVADDKVTITATATGGGYDGMTASFEVTVNDNDWMLEVSDDEIERGKATEVTVKLTRTASAADNTGGSTATTDITLVLTTPGTDGGIVLPDEDGTTDGNQVSINFADEATTATKKFSITVNAGVDVSSVIRIAITGVDAAIDVRPAATADILVKEASGG